MRQLTEKEAEDFLEQNDFEVVQRKVVNQISDLQKVSIPFPWVMKISSQKIMHKAKVGGIRLGIKSVNEAEKVFKEFSKIEFFEGVMIQEALPGVELVLGIKNTPEFGHAVMFGKGGSNVEKEKDVAFRIYPLKDRDVEELIEEPKIFKSLDKDSIIIIVETIAKIQSLIKKYPLISELDINPLFVSEKAVVADARIVFK